MPNPDFSDAALLLVGHGSTRNADSASPTSQHANELRRRRIFGQVLECFLKQEPLLTTIRREISAPRIFVVPLFTSEGYFTEQVIPRKLDLDHSEEHGTLRRQRRGSQTLYYCGPVGTHPSMTEVILARAREVVEQHSFPRAPKPADSALFIAGHGTGSDENSRKSVENQARLITARSDYAEVHAVFIEEEPRIGDCYKLARVRNLVMVPFFISDGLHANEDIPVLLGEPGQVVRERLGQGQPTWRNPTEKHGKRLWYASSVGTDPRIADIILERVTEAVQPIPASSSAAASSKLARE